jgi:hypothetical protein
MIVPLRFRPGLVRPDTLGRFIFRSRPSFGAGDLLAARTPLQQKSDELSHAAIRPAKSDGRPLDLAFPAFPTEN